MAFALLAACSEESVRIEDSSIERVIKDNAYMRTTKIEINDTEETAQNPEIRIIFPKDGSIIKNSTVAVNVSASNFRIVEIGKPPRKGEGHFHVWLDSDKRVTADSIISFDNIVSGKHTIVAELVQSNHSSLSPKVTKAITIDVESDYVPPKQEMPQGIAEFTVESDDNGFYPSTIKAKIGDKVKISFKFRDSSIYFAGIDIKGPFQDINYKLKGEQPITREFTMKDETKITSYWPASGVRKAVLTVEIQR
ncbi:hypothetical protein HYV80_04645 [Candidatus Woesearchaeota archaeon]|nr:hypothetical protein [Candidatus Woesearchaeota archaeon]